MAGAGACQVLHGGDLICEGVVRALKAAPQAAATAAPTSAEAASESTEAAPTGAAVALAGTAVTPTDAAAAPAGEADAPREVPANAEPAPADEPREPVPEKALEWAFSAMETVEAQQFYNAVSRTGIRYGPHFRMVQRTNIASDTAAQLRCAPCHFCCASDGLGAWQGVRGRLVALQRFPQ